MIRKTCLLATRLLPATALNAANLILNNVDFQGAKNGAGDFDPTGWTVCGFTDISPSSSAQHHKSTSIR